MSKRQRRRSKAQKRQAPVRAAAVARRPSFDEIGGTGLRVSGGRVLEEYNPDLKGPKLYSDYDKMLRGDGQVQAVELVVSLPIESAKWRIDPNKAKEPIDLEIADTVATNLFDGMTCTWEDVISETVMSALIGVNGLEKVWEPRDGRTWLRKLAPRHPRTIQRWIFDHEGGVQGIVQRVVDPVTGMVQDKPIEIARLLRFTYRGHGGNPEGRGLMRPMRTHWYIKHALYNIANVGMEGLYNPAAFGKLPENYNAADRDQYLAVLRHFGRGVMLPPGYEQPGFAVGNQRLPNIVQYIQYHDTLIARSALAQFLQLGSGETGSWALSDSHVTLFLMALEQIVKRIASVFDRYLIPEMVGYNYPGVNRFPSLKWSPIAHIMQRAAILNVLQGLASAQLIEMDEDIEGLIRDMLGLPEKPESDESDVEETIPQEDAGASRRYRSLSAAQRKRPRDRKKVDSESGRRAALQAEFTKDMARVVKDQHGALMKRLDPMIDAFLKAPPLEKGKHLRKMQDVAVPKVGTYADLLTNWMRRLYTEARDKAAKDLQVEVPDSISNALRSYIATKAQVIAQKHAEDLRAAVLFEVLESTRQELSKAQIVANAKQAARDKSTIMLQDDLTDAGRELVATLEDMLSEMIPEQAASAGGKDATESPESISGV